MYVTVWKFVVYFSFVLFDVAASQDCSGFPQIVYVAGVKDDVRAGAIKNVTGVTGITGVSITGQNASDTYDASLFVTVTAKDDVITFAARQSMYGILDWPSPSSNVILQGECEVTCGTNHTGEFQVQISFSDANTATPHLSAPAYSLTVDENYPTSVPLTAVTVSAYDADRDSNNYEITFSVSDSTFSLTSPVKTADWPATYSTQLVLAKPLDYSVASSYKFKITAQDGGGLSSSSDVTLIVRDIDNQQPQFLEEFYTAEVFDKTAVGEIAVKPSKIQAEDPDTGGPLTYSLITNDAVWSSYFRIDPDKGTVRLVKEIPDTQTLPEELSFTVQAKETAGQFACQTTLRIQMTPTPGVPVKTNVTGYIVGIAVLGALLVVVIVVALVDRRRRNKYRQPHDKKSDTEALFPDEDTTAHNKPSKHGGSSYDNPAFEKPQNIVASFDSTHYQPSVSSTSNQLKLSIDPIRRHAHPITESHHPIIKHIEQRPPTPPPTRSKNPSISSTLPPIAETDSAPASPTDFSSSSIPFGPDEPIPDYSLKSVGFNDTVECVTIEDTKEQEEQAAKEEAEKLAENDRAELEGDGEKMDASQHDHGDAVKQDEISETAASDRGEEGSIKKSIEVITSGEDDEETTVM